MTGARRDREPGRRIAVATGAVVVALSVAAGLVGGGREAAGALVGGAITIADFLWLRGVTGFALRARPAPEGGGWRRALWIGASATRLGVVALLLAAAVSHGSLGLGGLLLSLAALPAVAVGEGLRAARAA